MRIYSISSNCCDFVICRCLLGKRITVFFEINQNWVMVSNIVYFHPENWGRWTHFDDHIFQMGWSNHQLGKVLWDVWCQDICNPCYHHYLIVCGKFFSSFLYGASLSLRGAAGEACQRAQERIRTNFFSYKDRGKHPCFCDWKWRWADSIAFLLGK